MTRFTLYPRNSRQLFASFVVAIITAVIVAGAGYQQIRYWLINQQESHIQAAVVQIDAVILNAVAASQAIFPLAGERCTPEVLRQMRHVLAITPNVANLELSLRGTIYCTTLSGPGDHPVKESHTLYLTTLIDGLDGHPYLVYQHKTGSTAAYASIDGSYLRNILASASDISPVMLVTGEGTIDAHGELKTVPKQAGQQATLVTASSYYPYRLTSHINHQTVLAFIRSNSFLPGIIILITAVLAGSAFYFWRTRSHSPVQLLEDGIRKGEFVPYVQPIISSCSYEVVGGEVLMRWLRQGEIIPPDQFIPAAEQSGLIIPMTQSLFDALSARLGHGSSGEKQFYLSINISAAYFQSGVLVRDFKKLRQALDKNISLAIEITEREMLTDSFIITENISALKALGVLFFLDDFGTGYSSLDYLQRMEIDCIKIDKAFIDRVGGGIRPGNLIDNIIDLAKRLELKTIAEGVETEVQARWLHAHGVDSLQGYWFSRPVSLDEFININLVTKYQNMVFSGSKNEPR